MCDKSVEIRSQMLRATLYTMTGKRTTSVVDVSGDGLALPDVAERCPPASGDSSETSS